MKRYVILMMWSECECCCEKDDADLGKNFWNFSKTAVVESYYCCRWFVETRREGQPRRRGESRISFEEKNSCVLIVLLWFVPSGASLFAIWRKWILSHACIARNLLTQSEFLDPNLTQSTAPFVDEPFVRNVG